MTLHFQDWRGALSNIRLLRGYRKPRRNHRSHVCANTEPLRHFRCAQVDLGYCNTV